MPFKSSKEIEEREETDRRFPFFRWSEAEEAFISCFEHCHNLFASVDLAKKQKTWDLSWMSAKVDNVFSLSWLFSNGGLNIELSRSAAKEKRVSWNHIWLHLILLLSVLGPPLVTPREILRHDGEKSKIDPVTYNPILKCDKSCVSDTQAAHQRTHHAKPLNFRVDVLSLMVWGERAHTEFTFKF